MRNKGIIKKCIVVLLFYIVAITCLSCSISNVPNAKVEVKLIIDGKTYKYDWDYGKYFSLDLKKEFPNILYYNYYLDKEYKDYCEYEPVTNDLTLYVKTFKEPSEELIAKAKEDFVKKYNHELRGECFMQINNDIFIISYSDILDFDSEYAARNGIISNVRLNKDSFIFPYEKSSLALWSDGKFYFNKELEDKLHKYESSFLEIYYREKNDIFITDEECSTFSLKINEEMYTVVNEGTEKSQKLGTLFDSDRLVSYYNIWRFDGQMFLGNKIVFKVVGVRENTNSLILRIVKCFGDSNVDEEMFYDELKKLDFVDEITVTSHKSDFDIIFD